MPFFGVPLRNGVPIGLGSVAGFGISPFDPSQLFASGEQGAWYDPSDLTTMFQNNIGTTPVTAVAQPVGLILDKSKGLTLGSEVVTNGGPNFTSSTGWAQRTSVPSGSASVVSGNLRVNSGGTPFGGVYTAITTVIGRTYKVSANATFVSGTSGTLRFLKADNTDPTGTVRLDNNANTTVSAYFIATASTTYIHLQASTANTIYDWSFVSVREIAGNHASQSTPDSRPVFQQDNNGFYYLLFDGTDDSLAVANINFSSTNKMTIFAGVRKLRDATSAVLCELSTNSSINFSSFLVTAPSSNGAVSYGARFSGTINGTTTGGGVFAAAPDTSVVTAIGDIPDDITRLRRNGSVISTTTSDLGTGNFGNYPLYIGRRGDNTLPYEGHIYSLIVRGAQSTDAEIASTETWVNSKTGAY